MTVLATMLSTLRDNLGVEEKKGKAERRDEKGECVCMISLDHV